MIIGVCTWCGKEVRRAGNISVKILTCCREHRKLWMNENRHLFTGSNNPNYGNRWGDELRKQQSERSKGTLVVVDSDGNKFRVSVNDERFLSGELVAESKGRKFSEETRQKMSKSKKGKRPFEMTDDIRRNIGIASKNKWTDDYKVKHRKTMEKLGYWIPLEEKSDYDVYFVQSNWKERMVEYVSIEEKDLLSKRGMFCPYKNKNGLVRDHIYSRFQGFVNCIDPLILTHPVNCQFITKEENISKGNNEIWTKDDLFDRILKYQGSYQYHDEIIERINKHVELYTKGGPESE